MTTSNLQNYVLTNQNRKRVEDKIEAIAGRLSSEGVDRSNYSKELAEAKLAPCVSGPTLISLLSMFEKEVIALL